MTDLIDGPRLEPKSGRADCLVVLLHGYGADGNDLIPIGRHWASALPNAAFVAPDAPQPCEMSPFGRQWFPLTITMEGVRSSPEERWQGALAAAPHINDFLEGEFARLGLDESRLALAGFSQGAMMALHVGLRRRKCPAAVISFSGMLVGEEHLEEISSRPPVFMAHGDMDDVVPFAALEASAKALRGAGIEVRTHIEHGVGHGIDMQAMELAGDFLAHHLSE